MNAVASVICDLQEARERLRSRSATRDTDAYARIGRCIDWLSSNGLECVSFKGSLFGYPYVLVGARPEVYALFSGRYEFKGYKQEGALRYVVREGFDRVNKVYVRWMEVVACQ